MGFACCAGCGITMRNRNDIDAPVAENLEAVANALERPINDVTVVILDRPRHAELIAAVRSAGARIKLISDGDVDAAGESSYLKGARSTPLGTLRESAEIPQASCVLEPGECVFLYTDGLVERRDDGIIHRLQKDVPGKSFEPIREAAVCRFMKMITLEKARNSLRDLEHVVSVEPEIAARARGAIDRMVAIG